MRKGYREIIAGLLLLTVFFSGLLAGTAKAENGDTGNYTDTETEDEDNYEATEEAFDAAEDVLLSEELEQPEIIAAASTIDRKRINDLFFIQ